MSSEAYSRDPVERLAEEFVARYRRGEHPSLTEYTERYPELAEQIRDLFPALVMMEQFGSVAGPLTGPFAPTAQQDSTLPEQLGDYRILREVGRGGMGVVYEAVQESLGRHVALKILPFHQLMNPTHLERFRREARAAAQLHHSNIVSVFGVGESEGIHYYAMQFIQGQGLDAVLEEVRRLRDRKHQPAVKEHGPAEILSRSIAQSLLIGRFESAPAEAWEQARAGPVAAVEKGETSAASNTHSELASQTESQYCRSVAQVGMQVAEALAYAHKQRILHRDIKPSNLLLDLKGTVWITDFGLAKIEGSEELTTPGDIVGTVRYMAPERFQGQAEPRSDVYSLGITLYEMLTLRPAFTDSNRARLIERVVQEEPRWPRKGDRHIPRDLETIVRKAIAKEPAARYATAEALATDLRRFLSGEPIAARPVSSVERLWRWCRRKPALAGLTGSLAGLLLLIALASSLVALYLQATVKESENNRQAAVEAHRLGQEKLWLSYRDQAKALLSSQKAGQRFGTLHVLQEAVALGRELHLPEERFGELRHLAIASLALPDVEVIKEWSGFPLGTDVLDIDDAFRHYARAGPEGTVSIRRVSDDQETLWLPGSGARAVWLRFSPDGRFLGVVTSQGAARPLQVWKLAGDRPEPILEDSLQAGEALDFSRDSQQIAVGEKDGTIRVYDLATQHLHRQLKTHPLGAGQWLKFHPHKPWLAIGGNPTLEVWDLASGALLAELTQPQHCGHVAWHPDGKILAADCADRKLYLWDVPTRQRIQVLEGHNNDNITLVFHPAGHLLVSNDWMGLLRFWDVRTGKQVFSTPAGTHDQVPKFSTDGRLFGPIVDGRNLRLLHIASGSEFRTLTYHPGSGAELNSPTVVSPDGKLLVTMTGQRHGIGEPGLLFLDLTTGEERGHIPATTLRPAWFDARGALWTRGRYGVQSWPVQPNAATPGRQRFGPPQFLTKISANVGLSCSKDGSVFALSRVYDTLAFLRQGSSSAIRRFPQSNVRYCAVSPDGRWLATGTHNGVHADAVKVWDVHTGELIRDLPIPGGSAVAFSPDGHWLATSGGGCRLWAVDSWAEGPVLGGYAFVFSSDSKLLAVEAGPGSVRLIHLATGREYAVLEAPVSSLLEPQCFTADGAQLILWGSETRALHIWDLHAIRQHLVKLDLAGDLPPLAPSRSDGALAPPRISSTVELDFGNAIELSADVARINVGLQSFVLALNPFNFEAYFARGRAYGRLKDGRKSVADYSMALALITPEHKSYGELLLRRSNNYWYLKELPRAAAELQTLARRDFELPAEMVEQAAQQCGYFAWQYATGPEQERDLPTALLLAQKAVKLVPDQAMYWNTLGVVHYRLEQYPQALAAFERSLHQKKGEMAALDLYLLALCHAHQGHLTQARDYYGRAVRWEQEQRNVPPGDEEEVDAFRSEAKALLSAPAKP